MTSNPLPLEVSCLEVADLRSTGQDFVLVDCREPDEAAICRITSARLLPMSELTSRVGELAGAEQQRIIVHCHKGGRSLRVANWLREQGYANAQSMAGGIDQWALEIEPGMARY